MYNTSEIMKYFNCMLRVNSKYLVLSKFFMTLVFELGSQYESVFLLQEVFVYLFIVFKTCTL